MKETLTTCEIADRLNNDENGGWSYAGAWAMADYLEQLEEDIGEEMELDVVAIRCDYSEYGSLEEWATDYFGGDKKARAELYSGDSDIYDDEDVYDEAIREHISDNGTLIEFNGGIIVSSF